MEPVKHVKIEKKSQYDEVEEELEIKRPQKKRVALDLDSDNDHKIKGFFKNTSTSSLT
jgi:hypothetical protein